MYKFNTKIVREYFRSHGCTFLSSKYVSYNSEIKYRCKCGSVINTSFKIFKNKKNKCCRSCSYVMLNNDIKSKNGGLHHFQTQKFKDETKKKHLKKYGVTNPLKNKQVLNKLKKTNLERYGCEFVGSLDSVKEKIKQTFKRKYGVEHGHQNQGIRDKFNETIKERYGVPSLAYLSRCSSKESQRLFLSVYDKLSKSQQEKCYFAHLNQEFVVAYNKQHYKYDFVHSGLKRAIEYNGKNFHPHPTQKPKDVGWCAFHPNKTVKEARKYEKQKYQALEVRGYKILTIWDYEFKRDPEATIKLCLDFLLS